MVRTMMVMMMMMMMGARGNNWQYSRTDLHVSHNVLLRPRGYVNRNREREGEREREREREREGEKRKDVQFSSFP